MMSWEAVLLASLTAAVGMATVTAEAPTATVVSVRDPGLSQRSNSQLQLAAVT